MTLSFLADEHVDRVFVAELRAQGHFVAWIDEDYEPGTSDHAHLQRSVDDDLVILSNDADFASVHDEYDHGGIVLYDDQNVSVTTFVAAIKRIERFVPRRELRGRLLWLDEWCD